MLGGRERLDHVAVLARCIEHLDHLGVLIDGRGPYIAIVVGKRVAGFMAAHCGDIISQMLQFARCQAPSKEATSVNQLVEKTLSFIGHEFKKRRADMEQRATT